MLLLPRLQLHTPTPPASRKGQRPTSRNGRGARAVTVCPPGSSLSCASSGWPCRSGQSCCSCCIRGVRRLLALAARQPRSPHKSPGRKTTTTTRQTRRARTRTRLRSPASTTTRRRMRSSDERPIGAHRSCPQTADARGQYARDHFYIWLIYYSSSRKTGDDGILYVDILYADSV